MKKMHLFYLSLGLTLFAWAAVASAADFHLSGGGTGMIAAAITDHAATGGTIILDDSQTYNETEALKVGQRNSVANGRVGFNIEAATGAKPTIAFNGGGFVIYAGSADLHVGTNAGGRIKIDARNALVGGGSDGLAWYIGQEDGAPSGAACKATFENLDIDMTGKPGAGWVFGAGGNDAAPLTTGAALTLRNVKTTGAAVVVQDLYGPASYASTVTVDRCQFLEFGSIGVELGAYGLGGNDSVVNFTRSILYQSPAVAAAELNSVVGRLGTLNIDHCDVINEGPTSVAARAVTLVGAGACAITNSIIRGDAGTVNFGSWTATVANSNVSATTVANAGFTFDVNSISEWPVYVAYGLDSSVSGYFVVNNGMQSKTLGATPPVGSGGIPQVPVTLAGFSVD